MKILVTPRSFGKNNPELFDALRDAGLEIIRNDSGGILSEEAIREKLAPCEGVILGVDPMNAAVLAAGSCGFGMGATPNAMANMQALTDKFVPSIKAYLLVPIIGSMFADFINSITITIFINMF